MKKIDFTKPGGFPLEQNTLAFMQDAYNTELLQAFLKWVGNPSLFAGVEQQPQILQGISVVGNNVSAGWIIRNSELLYFAGDSLSNVENDGIGVQTIRTSVNFKDNSVHNVYEEKIAVTGGASPVPLSDYRRVINLSDVRPILSFRMQRNTASVAAGAYLTLNLPIEQVKKGDVAVVQVIPEEGAVIQSVYSRVVAHAVVLQDGFLEVTLMNQDVSQSIPAGEKNFHIRIIK